MKGQEGMRREGVREEEQRQTEQKREREGGGEETVEKGKGRDE